MKKEFNEEELKKLMWGCFFRGLISGATGMAIISILILIRILVSCK